MTLIHVQVSDLHIISKFCTLLVYNEVSSLHSLFEAWSVQSRYLKGNEESKYKADDRSLSAHHIQLHTLASKEKGRERRK